jgi:hypothetical protein
MVRRVIWQLFVLSPYPDIAAIAALMKAAGRNHVLCAHLLTPVEQRQLHAADPTARVELMRDYATDGELERLDEEVHADIMSLARMTDASELIQIAHTPLYVRAIKRARNRLVAEKFLEKYGRPERLLVCSGPNVDEVLWREVCGGIEQVDLPRVARTEHTPVHSRVTSARTTADTCDIAITSLSGLKRTRLIDEKLLAERCIEVRELRKMLVKQGVRPVWDFIRLMPALWLIRGQQQRLGRWLRDNDSVHISGARNFLGWRALASMAVNMVFLRAAGRNGVRFFVTSIHSFSPAQAWAARKEGMQVLVLQDGYLPINYPVTLYFQYRSMTMIWWSELARHWGARGGLTGFTGKPIFSGPSSHSDNQPASAEIRQVLALLGHGGEWTSLIWRCDIDRFVQGVLEVARLLPAIEFRLRPHPTCNLEMHDGTNCVERLRCHVSESGVDNVTLSSGSLAEDFSWADFAVSEYSLTLLEFVASSGGGVGVFNPTKRRDFFAEFTRQGMPYAETVDTFAGILKHGTRVGRDAFQGILSAHGNDLRHLLHVLGEEKTLGHGPVEQHQAKPR